MGPNELLDSLRAQGIRDARVLEAIAATPRDRFLPEEMKAFAWEDTALPIGLGQTISQPFIVAAMLEWLELRGDERVLDVGTGSGYQAAVLAHLARAVYSLEIVPELHRRACGVLASLGLSNVRCRLGDGRLGWPEAAPFDAAAAAAAADSIPEALLEQLAPGGRLVMPLGGPGVQQLVRARRVQDGSAVVERGLAVRFVPLVEPGSSPGPTRV
jgi:protein-L-isoaspartate(D-aspartate) O-methyltransferase